MKSGTYDIGISWINPVEEKFVISIKKAAKAKRLSVFEVTYKNAKEVFFQVEKGNLHFKTFFDRASLDESAFLLVAEKLKANGARVINEPSAAFFSSGKAELHTEYKKNGLPVPKTIIFSEKTPKKDLARIPKVLGIPFVLKPSHGGAGEGVNVAAKSAEEIKEFQKDLASDKGLAQEYVIPAIISKKTAWFRPVFATGEVIPLWWDPNNHFYQLFGKSKNERDIVKKLELFARKIAKLTNLELFSYEVMITEKGKYLIVDYANQPIDLNTQDSVPDGLPPEALNRIVHSLTTL